VTQTEPDKTARNIRITRDKARAREWAEARLLRKQPIQIAREITGEEQNHTVLNTVTSQLPEPATSVVIRSLLR